MIDASKRTPLFDEHVSLGGKIVPFAGFSLPVHYPGGITAEHRSVRQAAGLFDVSHMGEIIDDLLVYRYADRYMLVVNGANIDKDLAWIERQARGFDVRVEDASDRTALLALQGPRAREVLRPLTTVDLDTVPYYRFREGEVAGVPATVSATGYTGEDGFELYMDADGAIPVWRALLTGGKEAGLVPAGLGARDSLRLEMGYPLYGNDLNEAHTPLESGLGWVAKLDKGPFVGRDALVAQKNEGVRERLVGLVASGRGFPRPGYPILAGGDPVGTLSSGTVSPSLGTGIGLGYVPTSLAAPGTPLEIDARGRRLGAEVTRPPFYTEGSIRR
jgi:aminomethyltransferase